MVAIGCRSGDRGGESEGVLVVEVAEVVVAELVVVVEPQGVD